MTELPTPPVELDETDWSDAAFAAETLCSICNARTVATEPGHSRLCKSPQAT